MLTLLVQSAGAGLGVFAGTLIGLSIRKRGGKTQGLLAGSVVLTAIAAGLLALVVMMLVKAMTGGTP